MENIWILQAILVLVSLPMVTKPGLYVQRAENWRVQRGLPPYTEKEMKKKINTFRTTGFLYMVLAMMGFFIKF